MDFDDAKENIQPLVQGRNASILHASLKVESSQELLNQRKKLEKEIHNYTGDDPLSVWYNYIEWIEQSFPSGGKESGLQEVLSKCLTYFESDERYKQDRRMIKLYIKFIDSHKDPAECYQQLFNAGLGTMVADFYIAWAYCYDLVGNTRKADEVFRRGIACRAQPLEELQEAYQHFGFSVAQRIMYNDDDTVKEETNRQLHERRLALTSLRGHRRQQIVGSIRTGSAVKSVMPGKLKLEQPSTSAQRSNSRVQIFKDENDSPDILKMPPLENSITTSTSTSEEGKSVVRSIIDAARNQENLKEPGPWNKAHNRKKAKLYGKPTASNEIGFEIHEDNDDDDDNHDNENVEKPCIPPVPIADHDIKFDKPFIYPTNFCVKSKPIKGWATPVTTEEMPDKKTIPQYNKCKLYPRPNMEFQPEELKAYYVLLKLDINNEFTKERKMYWGCGAKYSIRLYPHFAKQSKPQEFEAMDEPYIPEKLPGLKVNFNEIYNKEDNVERQFEEILALRIKTNITIIKATDMEETICATSEKIQRRKSFFPLRKSMVPSAFRESSKISMMPENSSENEKSTIKPFSKVISLAQDTSDEQDNRKPTTEASYMEEVFLIPKVMVNKEETLKSTTQDVVTGKPASVIISAEPFKIFQDDDSVLEVESKLPSTVAVKTSIAVEDNFQFKTPALPIANSAIVATESNKLPFEIYDEENLLKNSPNSIPKPDFSCGTGGFFDSEETCSTQTFNLFLKVQSVSTPKAITKSQPQRQFGNILKEVTVTSVTDQKDEQYLIGPSENQNFTAVPEAITATPVTAYSPPRQQLSTILEISEHGTTQGTHTTGATTKSTLSSPEFEVDVQLQTANTAINYHQSALETVKEVSNETSNLVSSSQNMDNLMDSLKIQNDTDVNILKPQSENFATPAALRLQKQSVNDKCSEGALNFSIFEDTIDKNQKQVGNFSRLEEKEDTATGAVFKTLPQIRFQDDKTETIAGILIANQQVKFQDDKTETISKMLLAPAVPIQFQEDKTETLSKILLDPPQPIKFPEDRTETISKIMLASPTPAPLINEDDKKKNISIKMGRNQPETISHDDSFEFFRHTPPKSTKHLITYQLPHVRTAAETQTPLKFDSKRFCDKDTPDIQKTKSLSKSTALLEDEQETFNKTTNRELTHKSINNHKVSLSNILLIEGRQSVSAQNKMKTYKSKSVFRDSFVPDFSITEDSQPHFTAKPTVSKNTPKISNETILPEFSFNESTQSKQLKSTQIQHHNTSYIADFSFIPETQVNESILKPSDAIEPKTTSIKTFLQSSFQKDLFKTNDVKENVDDIMHWEQAPKPKIVSNETQEGTTLQNILLDTYMKDFSAINEPPRMYKNINEITMVQPSKRNSSLKFLRESVKQKSEISNNTSSKSKDQQISFLTQALPLPQDKLQNEGNSRSNGNYDDKFFELNCETEMFGTNTSMIQNSTWLPNHGPSFKGNHDKQLLSQIQEQSLHIKAEDISSDFSTSPSILKSQHLYRTEDSSKPQISFINRTLRNNEDKLPAILVNSPKRDAATNAASDDDCEMSIYYKHTPKILNPQVHIWDDADAYKITDNNHYVHAETDLNQTHQVIENMCIDPNVNPFNVDLINAFLEQHYVISYLERLPTCKMVGCIQRLRQNATLDIKGEKFEVVKLIGEGAYGAVFCGKQTSSGKLVAMKQEKPPNYWEYYICLEIHERIQTDEMLLAFMSVDYALIGNNSSILISSYSQYGSLITVCNKIKKHTMKNVDEYVVMLLASELLEIMDHLHAVNIIHADVKADNFLLINKLTYPPTQRSLQLIDFGVSVDMKLFKQGQTFSFVHNDNAFKCPEMREQRPWTYQLDLYGLAGVLHVLLFGKYMDIEKKARGFWMHKTHVPRYFNKNLWNEIFKTLLNIRDCKTMPNLQDLRALLKKEIEEKEKYVLRMIHEFNRALST